MRRLFGNVGHIDFGRYRRRTCDRSGAFCKRPVSPLLLRLCSQRLACPAMKSASSSRKWSSRLAPAPSNRCLRGHLTTTYVGRGLSSRLMRERLLTLPMHRSQLCALISRDRTNSPIRTAREALQFLRIVFGDTRRRTARFPLRLRFREPRSLIAASKWQTDVGPIGEAWNAGARAVGRALQRRRVEDRRPERQPASGIARCFATQKARENYVKVSLAAPP